VLGKYIDDIRNERRRAKVIHDHLTKKYKSEDVFILTANPKGNVIGRMILSEIPEGRIILVNGLTYVEDKKKALEKLKTLGEAVYVADKDEIDFVAAKEAGVDYVNISLVIEELERVEKDLYKLGTFSA
jgi:hypothetical protein